MERAFFNKDDPSFQPISNKMEMEKNKVMQKCKEIFLLSP